MAWKKGLVAIAICLVASLAVLLYPQKNKEVAVSLVQQGDQVVIVPHLDSAKNSRQSFISNLQIQPSDIIVLSTNHFNVASQNIIYSNSPWNLELAELNKGTVSNIRSSSNADDLVKTDHGIRNVVADLAAKFPKASYHSYLVKSASGEELSQLKSEIDNFCKTKNCLVAGSVDFSHYNPSSVAKLHDCYAIKALEALDYDKIKDAETDSPEVLEVVARLADGLGLKQFKLDENLNTGKQSKDVESETTSWVIGSFQKAEQDEIQSTQLMFAGDIMMDRLVDARFKSDFTKLFSEFKERVFAGVDASMANFEGPLNDGPVPQDVSSNNLSFNFPLNCLDGLKYIGLDGFTLANNHTLNDGTKGLSRTRSLLGENKFFTFGSPKGIDEFSLKTLETNPGVSLIGLNVLEEFDEAALLSLIKEQKTNDKFVIIYPHWGAEYQTTHGASQEKLAHKMIDAGADLIIGSHPHVVQDSEIYQGKAIFYSLGNFVFDQLFSEETQHGLIVGVDIDSEIVRLNLVPVESKQMKPQLARGEIRRQILERAMPKDFSNQLENGIIELNR